MLGHGLVDYPDEDSEDEADDTELDDLSLLAPATKKPRVTSSTAESTEESSSAL